MGTVKDNPIPRHVGFIMDGNGRWATERHKPRNYGHKKGADVIEGVVTECFDRGVEAVSLYAFSTENWSRPKEEIDEIFSLLKKFLKKYSAKLIREKIRLVISGDIERLTGGLKEECLLRERETACFSGKTLNIAIGYGGRAEIVRAVNLLKGKEGDITEEDISGALYTAGLPDLDLIVRTSGEQRISNFMLWQGAYAELYFTPTFWPDFKKDELEKALLWYAARHRRFGGV